MSCAPKRHKSYSIWMAESIMACGQGLAASDGDSGQWLRVGFFQRAILELLDAKPECIQKQDLLLYLEQGCLSVVPLVLNAEQNVQFSLDRLCPGEGLLYQYEKTKDETYHVALEALRRSIDLQPRNELGGLWYFRYPHLSYLDGMYMLVPFVLRQSRDKESGEAKEAVRDLLYQIHLLWKHCYNEETGLLVHGYDASKTREWADHETGASPHVWGRALGWYVMSLLCALESEIVRKESSESRQLHYKFDNLIKRIVQVVDPESKCWWQVMCRPGQKGNYIESSCSAMFVYCILRGVRLGFLTNDVCAIYNEGTTATYTELACASYNAIVEKFVAEKSDGTLGYTGTVDVCSLNSPASYEYYIGQPIALDSVLGSAAFVLASAEMERLSALHKP